MKKKYVQVDRVRHALNALRETAVETLFVLHIIFLVDQFNKQIESAPNTFELCSK